MRYLESQKMIARAEKVIPLGSQTFSKSRTQYPEHASPLFLTHGRGGRVWDVDGNEYVDLVCGLMPIVLGYNDEDVDAAIRNQLDRGIIFSLPSPLEMELAEKLVEIIPCAEQVRYGKNGSDATAAAVRVARAATGRDRIAVCGYHGWQDWYIGATVRNKGVPAVVGKLTHRFPYNDIDALHQLFNQYPGEFAAVIMEPANAVEPYSGYLAEVAEFTRSQGALFVFDETITGFHFALGGAQEYFEVTPDLATFGKGIANGMPLSAIVGRADLMHEMEEIFFSSTFGGEALSLAAALAVIDKMQRQPVLETLWHTGEEIAQGVTVLIQQYELEKVFSLLGWSPWKILGIDDHANARKEAIKTLLYKLLLEQGVLMNGSHNICYAHNDQDVQLVLTAYQQAFEQIHAELKDDGLEKRLGCQVIMPVFSVR